MSISKQKIISELKEKITEFKSKFKSGKSNEDNKENDLLEFPLNQDTLNNYYKLFYFSIIIVSNFIIQ